MYNKHMKNYLEIARFTKPQGLKGELRAQSLCDSPEILAELLGKFGGFYLDEGATFIKLSLREMRKGFVILKADGFDDINEASRLVGKTLYIARESYTLPKDTWFVEDLIGLEVVDADSGAVYGKVKEILQSAPKDVYVIAAPSGRQLLFPAIPEVLIDVNVAKGLIKIRPLKGLFDDED
ncbi:MAG: ribosome maturation factor RimM [Oscillospiraceae bacterium]|nr:ribosome maturation factor RimM [Oscillospiraceae bacterium]